MSILEAKDELFENNPVYDEESRNNLIDLHSKLVVHIARKFEGSKINLDELVDIGMIGLNKAIDTYKEDRKSGFFSYAYRTIESEIATYVTKSKKASDEASLDEALSYII